MDRSSSLSISPRQHDGYLADSEENPDLTSLQAQIQQARSNAKKSQRRKEASQEMKRRESKETTAGKRFISPYEISYFILFFIFYFFFATHVQKE